VGRRFVKNLLDLEAKREAADARGRRRGPTALQRKRHSMSHTLHTVVEVMIALSSLALLIWPSALGKDIDLDSDDRNQRHIP
jgi:hypothetical protein